MRVTESNVLVLSALIGTHLTAYLLGMWSGFSLRELVKKARR